MSPPADPAQTNCALSLPCPGELGAATSGALDELWSARFNDLAIKGQGAALTG